MPATKGNIALTIVLVLVLLGVGGYFALTGFRSHAVVEEVRLGTAVDAVPGSVEVRADKDLQELKIEGSGRVVECEALDPSRQFQKGDVLVRLDSTEIERAFKEAQREYKNVKQRARITAEGNTEKATAEKRLEDVRRLFELGDASAESVREAERHLKAAETQLALAELARQKSEEDFRSAEAAHAIQLRKMKVVAPVDGMVEGVRVNVGTLVSPGAIVATFYANERVVQAKISEEDIARVKPGDPAKVRLLSYPDQEFAAKVTRILPFADPETRRYTAYLDVKAALEQLKPHSTGEVTITVGEHDNVPLIPRRAVFNGNFVFVLNKGRVEKREIALGFKGLNQAEVTQGLKPGEQVIVEDLDQFRDGQRARLESSVNPKG